MSTLFDNTALPLWLWIVIIVVGSLCIIGAAVVVVVCMLRRRSTGSSVADLPTRRVTVRRGRVVPASHYLSLTGSKFGLNAFEEEARTTRSKSPFEWWNTLKEKRRSQHLEDGHEVTDIYTRHDATSSATSLEKEGKSPTAEVYEVEPMEPTPTLNRPARHTSFSRPFQTPAHQEPDTDAARDTQRHNRNLSMIKEASPHASMISSRSLERRSSRLSAYNPGEASRRERRPSDHSASSQHRRPSAGSQSQLPRPSQQSRRPSENSQHQSHPRRPSDSRKSSEQSNSYHSGSRKSSEKSSRRPSGQSSRHPSDRSSRSNRSNRSGRSQHRHPQSSQPQQYPIDSGVSLPSYTQPSSDEVPRPIAYRGSRHSLGEQEMTAQPQNISNTSLSKRSSLISRHDSLTEHTDLSRRPSRPKSLVLDDAVEYQQHQGPEYWASREEMMPEMPPQPTTPTTPTGSFLGGRTLSVGRAKGEKGNVLRKKSLKRQEVVSYVST